MVWYRNRTTAALHHGGHLGLLLPGDDGADLVDERLVDVGNDTTASNGGLHGRELHQGQSNL